MRVGLPMYDLPELRREVDAWWSGLAFSFRSEGVSNVPDCLDRSVAFDALWSAPNLLFAQACGYPMVGRWAGRLEYLATPRYAAPGCDGTSYCSWIVVSVNSTARTIEDLRGARCSINSRISHSGYNAMRALVAPLAEHGRFFGSVTESGGHLESLNQIQCGEADVAAIDCVTHALLSRCRPDVIAATRIIGRTVEAPGLPYVTRAPADSDLMLRLRAGLLRAFADPLLRPVRDVLLITGLKVLPVGTYRCMTDMEAEARRRRYFELG
jgi:ABC-type phosphate/phosphonate transport system substrate-binding protein